MNRQIQLAMVDLAILLLALAILILVVMWSLTAIGWVTR